MTEPKYHIGQTLILRDVNERRQNGSQEVTVSRVGRKLVYVKIWGQEKAFRIEDGRRNDNYGHQWLQTPEEYAESNRRTGVTERLRLDHHVTGWPIYTTTDTLERIADMLDQDERAKR